MFTFSKLTTRIMAVVVVFSISPVWADYGNDEIKKDMSWTLGFGMPSGEGVADYYGSTWLNLGLNKILRDDDTSRRVVSLGISAGTGSENFTVGYSTHIPEADYSARLFSLRYEHIVKTNSPFFWGGGLGIYFVNTEATYDAGDGWYWTATGEQKISMSNTSTTFAPHIKAGYQIRDKVDLELSVMLLNSTLAGNTSQYYYLPDVPDVKLSGLYTLSANFKF